jgi:hypothetical protein
MPNSQSINNNIGTYLGAPITLITGSASSKPARGEMYFDNATRDYQIYDGVRWHTLMSVTLNAKEFSVEELCDKHPGLADLKRELDEAKEKFDAYLALVKE